MKSSHIFVNHREHREHREKHLADDGTAAIYVVKQLLKNISDLEKLTGGHA